jgi:light-regulated signal transduction histidine kinase (bacteriophytochrome)
VVQQAGRVEHFETHCVANDGRDVEVSLAISPIRDGAVIAGVAVIARDIAERRATERELARARALLAERATELERSNGDLEQFAYVVSHDLSEPLRAISGFLQLLERRHAPHLDDDARRYIARSVEGAERMRLLIDDLLAYSRAGRGGAPMNAVDLNQVLADMLRWLEAPLRETGATLRADALPTVHGNAAQLGQVLQNLLSNALKFRQGSPTIEIQSRRKGDEWTISVLDDGIGVKPEFADRIFLVFKRLNGRGAYPGTGIGLAICKRVVESHGGRIWCEPRPEGGTAFHLTLPTTTESQQ